MINGNVNNNYVGLFETRKKRKPPEKGREMFIKCAAVISANFLFQIMFEPVYVHIKGGKLAVISSGLQCTHPCVQTATVSEHH